MKFHYYRDTDSLYIELSDKVGADSQEVAPGVVLDFDAESPDTLLPPRGGTIEAEFDPR